MTTIVYDHKNKEIAYDSRQTRDVVIITDSCEKMTEYNGVKFFLCGKVCDESLLIKAYFGDKPSEYVPECSAIIIENDNVYRIGVSEEMEVWKQPINHSDAMGSGWRFALSALDFGKSAKEAVEYAMTRDSCTGGEIKVIKL